MIKKNVEFKWGFKEKFSFEKIKEKIAQASALMSPDFNKYFIFYRFFSDISFAVVLT